MLKKILIIIVVVLMTIGLNSIVNAETEFTLDKSSVDVVLNGTKYIPYSGGTGTVTWSSEDTSIATVDNGTVRGLKIGETTITATRGEETATCNVKVVYNSIQIGANEGTSVSQVNLVLDEHNTENLYAKVTDYEFESVNDAVVNWTSSDDSTVAVDETSGTITAVKSGTATITAEAAGVSDTCEVTVFTAPEFTNFENAKYETSLNGYDENLKISGVTPKDSTGYNYYYIITSNNTKPQIITKHRSY